MAASLAYTSMAVSSYMMEGPAPEFKSLDDKYICVYCKQLLKQPQQIGCGCRICAGCVDKMLEGKTSALCPGGDEYCVEFTREEIYPDMATCREMSKLIVYCPYKTYGCNMETQWAKLKLHKDTCEWAVEECPHREFGCQEMVKTKEKDSHAATCSYKPKQCRHCRLHIAGINMESHVSQECDRAVIPCPYKCGEQNIIRGQLQEHRLTCRAKPQECRYKDVGCQFMGSEQEVKAHQAKATLVHLDLLYTQHVNDQKEVVILKRKNMELENTLESVKKEHTDFTDEQRNLRELNKFLEEKVNRLETNIATLTQDLIEMEEKVNGLEVTASTQTKKIDDFQGKLVAQDRKITTVEEKGGQSAEVTSKILRLERTMALSDMRMQELDQRHRHTETTTYNGCLIWKITDYARRKEEAVSGLNMSLYSQPFYTNRFGYMMCLRVYLNGDGIGRGTHMSLFFVLMKGEFDALQHWPFAHKVTLTLMDQERGIKPLSDMFRPDPTSSSFSRPALEMNVASGCPLFVSHTQLESSSFLKDDTLFIKCVVGDSDNTGL